ncbi:MAG: siroheme synthase CysG [Gammaproteobacteria bacterium]|nr:siroheme synthase CysG [Gammaproteobacteria bacterium]MCF6363425.1 siroheme synthase CysG [Gammaproteobacteria bacterium]
MQYFPMFFDISDRPCLVVGGGDVAARKVALLLRAAARVTVVSPVLGESLATRHTKLEISHLAREFDEEDLDNCTLVIAATDDEAVNRRISELCKARNLPVNVVDQPALCSFIVPSMIDRSPVQVAVSTGGAAPVLARLLRARLETMIPAAYGGLAELMDEFRDPVKARISEPEQRRHFWENVAQGSIAEMVFAGKEEAARAAMHKAVDEAAASDLPRGEVYLVGAGPGDPDLLTFRALRLLQQADVIVYDRLVSEEILDMARRDADLVYVGKTRDQHTLPQEDINLLLARVAKKGKRVLRLKGGDPFIFGRGGEEIETLMQEGVNFQIVPGITAAAGAASYAGIPLTHREYAQSVVFVTGHLKDGSMSLNWKALAQPHQTIVVYMGLLGVKELCGKLVEHGLPADMPIALVQKATTRRQKVVIGTLGSMPSIIETTEVKPPTLIIIGDVVRLHKKLSWFGGAKGVGEA